MTTYSQLDPRWKDIRLGFSNVTIGGYGCAITSIGMILDETPLSVNEHMKQVGGFAQGNLVIWEKIQEAFPNKVESIRRVWLYDNEDVKNNIPCVVQVDGTPIGAPMHFVTYKGEQKLLDPWGGVERPTSFYTPQSYCVIKLKAPINTNSQPTMSEQDKKDIESMRKLRTYNGVWYESQNIINDFEQLKADRKADNTNAEKSYLALELLYKDALKTIQTLQSENESPVADEPHVCQPKTYSVQFAAMLADLANIIESKYKK